MDNATRDGNFKASILGVSSAGFTGTVTVAVNPSTHAMLVETSGGGGGDVNLVEVGGSNITLGQKNMANSLPVVIASDQTAFPVTLTSTTITGTVAATQSGTWNVGSSSATGATVPANAFYVGGLNAAGNLEGRRNAAATMNTTTGIEASGMVAVFDDTSPTSITENQFGSVRMSANRNVYQTVRDSAGNERGLNVAATGNISIDTVTTLTGTTSLTPGVGAANLGKAEDAPHASGDTGVAMWGVRNDNLATTYGADQDYSPIATDLNGRTMVAQKASTATLSNVSTSGTSATLLAANSARIGATITNDAATVLFIKFGTTASATSYTVTLAGAASAPFSYYEVPAGYTGRIDGILASSTGTARVTEIS